MTLHPPAKDHQHVFREVLHDAERRCVTCGTSEVSEAFVRGLQAANQEVERLRADAEDIAEYRDTIRLQNEMYRELRARCARLEGALKPFARLEIPRKSQGNAGAYSIRHTDIEAARLALAPVGGDPDL